MQFNEWKESDNYLYSVWFEDIKKKLKNSFNDTDLEFDYFEYDVSTLFDDVYLGTVFFNEPDIMYKLFIYLDPEKFNEETVEDFTIELKGYKNYTNTLIGNMKRENVINDEFNIDYIIQLVDDFKTEYLEDELDIDDI